MKKLLSLLFTAAIVFSLTMPVFGAQDTSSQDTSKMEKKTKKTKAKKTKEKKTKDTGTGSK